MTTNAKLFTPNVQLGGANGLRYRLYRHGETEFSLTPRGKRFHAYAKRDACGCACRCGAFIEPATEQDRRVLARAKRF